MKKLKIYFFLLILAIVFTTCKKESSNTSNNNITTYSPPVILSGQWQKTTFPDLIYLASNGDKLYGIDSSGVISSSDGGASWSHTNFPVGQLYFNGNNIYSLQGGYKLFLSTDGGNSWTIIKNFYYGTNVSSIAFSGQNIFLAIDSWKGQGTGQAVFMSNDNGANWQRVDNGLLAVTNINALATIGTNIFAGSFAVDNYGNWFANNGVFLSSDNGTSWKRVSNGISDTAIISLATGGSSIYAMTYHGTFVSLNNGASWAKVFNGLYGLFNIAYIKIQPVNQASAFAIGYGALFLSNDNGNTYSDVTGGLPNNVTLKELTINGNNVYMTTCLASVSGGDSLDANGYPIPTGVWTNHW